MTSTVGIPLLVMSFSYGRIFITVRKHSGKWNNPDASRDTLGNRKAAVTIGIIVCLFVVTFIPSAVVYFMLLFEDNLCKEYQLNDVWLWVALVSFCHSSFNPWVYGFRYRELRRDFMAIFGKTVMWYLGNINEQVKLINSGTLDFFYIAQKILHWCSHYERFQNKRRC